MRWPAIFALFTLAGSESEEYAPDAPEFIPYYDCWSAVRMLATACSWGAHKVANLVS